MQDTNDHVMANIQRDGSYSVVPRIPGGEVTPEGLVVIGEVARDFGLYTKITGDSASTSSERVSDQLPDIWKRLVDAGFRVGTRLRQVAAHGEVVRRLDLVPLRRAGLRRHGRAARTALPGPALAAQDQVRRRLAAPASAPRPAAKTSGHRDRGRLEHVRRRQRRLHRRPRGALRRGARRRRAAAGDRPVPDVLHPHRRPLQRTAPWMEDYEGGLEALQASCSTTRWASPRTSTGRWPRTSTTTRTSGPRPSPTPRSSSGSRVSSTPPRSPTPRSRTSRARPGSPGHGRGAHLGAVFIGGTTLAVRS